MSIKMIETLTEWLANWTPKTTIIPFTPGETEWDFVNGQGVAGWCSFDSGNPFEATFVGQSVIKPIRGDKLLIKMKSGKVGVFQIYWFLPLFVDEKWKARACFVGYRENYAYKTHSVEDEARLPVRALSERSPIALVASSQAIDTPSLEKLADSYPKPDHSGVGGPRPTFGKFSGVSAEPVDRAGEQGKV